MALGCTQAQIAKSLVFVADGDPVVCIASGAHRVDWTCWPTCSTWPRSGRPPDEVRAATGLLRWAACRPSATGFPWCWTRICSTTTAVWAAGGDGHSLFDVDPRRAGRVHAGSAWPRRRLTCAAPASGAAGVWLLLGRRRPARRARGFARPPSCRPVRPGARDPGWSLDLRYAARRNMTGARLPGYCRRGRCSAPWRGDRAGSSALLRRRGLALGSSTPTARRGRRGRWCLGAAYRAGHLVGTYIARRSNHNLGAAVDLTLVRGAGRAAPADGHRLRHLGPAANTLNARGRVLRNRLTLVRAMERHGFSELPPRVVALRPPLTGPRYLDISLGC